MKRYEIAIKAVPYALRTANTANALPLNEKDLVLLSGELSSLLTHYKCRNKKVILETAVKTAPEFSLIADDFFLILNETPAIAESVHSENYEEIVEFILEHRELTAKERKKLYEKEHLSLFMKLIKILQVTCGCITGICAVTVIGIYLFSPEVRQQVQEQAKHCKNKLVRFIRIMKDSLAIAVFIIHKFQK